MKNNDINLKVYPGETFFMREALDEIQAIFRQFLPTWSKKLRVHQSNAGNGAVQIESAGALYDAIAADHAIVTPFYAELERQFGSSPGPRTNGIVELRGTSSAITVVLCYDKRRFHKASDIYVWGNSLAIQVRKSRVEDQECITWAHRMFVELCTRLRPWYGRGYSVDELESKNMVLDHGAYAIGGDISKALPGLYWLNYFGKTCVETIGRDRFDRATAHEKCKIGDGVMISLDQDPRKWSEDRYQLAEQRVRQSLGPEYFFSRQAPDAETVSPVFVQEN